MNIIITNHVYGSDQMNNHKEFLIKVKKLNIDKGIRNEILQYQQDEVKDLQHISIGLNNNIEIEKFNLIENSDLDSLIENESKLEKIGDEIRGTYMLNTYKTTHTYYKSPANKKVIKTLNGNRINLDYERLITYREFENSIVSEDIRNFSKFNIIYSSAMASIIAIINLIDKVFENKKVISGLVSAGYYETITFLQNKLSRISYQDMNNKYENYGQFDFYLIEPVKAKFSLETSDIYEIMTDISKFNDKLKFVIIDTSLQGNSFNLDSIIEKINSLDNIIIVNIRSGLKLDQEGMEISNFGIVTYYFSKSTKILLESIRLFLEKNRGIYDNSLSYHEVCLLDNNVFLKNNSYSKLILGNTKKFTQLLGRYDNKLFKKMFYPNTDEYNYLSPYVFLQFKDEKSNFSDYQLLLDIVYQEVLDIGLNANIRNSFGFRNISCEVFKLQDNKCVFKIAPGKLIGVRFYHILHLIDKISELNLQEFRKLRKNYVNNNWGED